MDRTVKISVVVVWLVLLMTSVSWSKTIHVPADSSTIQGGIDGATDGDTVLVADGIYTGEGNKNLDFLGKAIVVRSVNGPDSNIIDCGGGGRGFYFHSGEDFNSMLEGFTISAGSSEHGGGILIDNSSPSIESCVIAGNWAQWGGGIFCGGDCKPLIANCIITQNGSSRGGGLECWYSSPICSNCVITGNDALFGGGIRCDQSHAYFTKCIISKNEVFTYNYPEAFGGGIYSEDGAPTINNCIISHNRAEAEFPPTQHCAWGGGITCDSATIINCTIVGNFADNYGGGISFNLYPPFGVNINIANSILWDNQPDEIDTYYSGLSINNSDIKGGWPGEGNIDENPLFRDPENGDYHLMATYCGDPYDSPCIDAGDPNILDDSLDCWHGLGMDRSDMGAYGGANAGWPTAVGEDGGIVSVPEEFMLFQNYPNPFNSETMLHFHLPTSGYVNLHVYNILGQRLKVLVEEYRKVGEHRVIWDATDFPSGIYFARLETGGRSQTVKMVLLK